MGSRVATPLLAVLMLLPALAHAETIDDVTKRPRRTLSIGVGGGGHEIDGGMWGGAGVEMGFGWRLQRGKGLEAIGMLTLQRLSSADDDGDGAMGRLALLARYPIASKRFDHSATGQIFLQAGAGYARYSYDGGGSMERRELLVGIGGNLLGFIKGRDGEPRFPGFTMDMNIVFADAPDALHPGIAAVMTPDASDDTSMDIGIIATCGFSWGL